MTEDVLLQVLNPSADAECMYSTTDQTSDSNGMLGAVLAGATAPSSVTNCHFQSVVHESILRVHKKNLQSHSKTHKHRGYNFAAWAK